MRRFSILTKCISLLVLLFQVKLLESRSLNSNNGRNAATGEITYNEDDRIGQNQKTPVGAAIPSNNITKGPPIIDQLDYIHTISVFARDNVELKCPITSEPPPLYDWFKLDANDERIRIDTSWERFDLSGSNGRNTIYIHSVTHEDGGDYICEAINGFGKSSFTIQLIVTGEDPFKDNFLKSSSTNRKNGLNNNNSSNSGISLEKPDILLENLPKEKSIRVMKGANWTLKCEAKGNPKPSILWYKNNFQVTGSKLEISTLKFVQTSEADSGAYKCEALSYLGKSTYEVTVIVEVESWQGRSKAEIVDLSPHNLTLFPGENGSISCVAKFENEFQPYFFWVKKVEPPYDPLKNLIHHNGSYFEVLSRTEIRENAKHLFTSDLILKNVSRTDAGSYHCVVTGLMGYSHSEAHVFVHGDPVHNLNVQLNKERAATIQWAVLSTFLFLIVIILILACVYRFYYCQSSVKSRFPFTKSNGNILQVTFIPSSSTNSSSGLIKIPERSPGETTMTTTLSNPAPNNNIANHDHCSVDLLASSVTSTGSSSQQLIKRSLYHFGPIVAKSEDIIENYIDDNEEVDECELELQNNHEKYKLYNFSNAETEDYHSGELAESELSCIMHNKNDDHEYLQDSDSTFLPSTQSPQLYITKCANNSITYHELDTWGNSPGPVVNLKQNHVVKECLVPCHSLKNGYNKNCHKLSPCNNNNADAQNSIGSLELDFSLLKPPLAVSSRNHRHIINYQNDAYDDFKSTPTASGVNHNGEKKSSSNNKRKRKHHHHHHHKTRYQQPPSTPVSFYCSSSSINAI